MAASIKAGTRFGVYAIVEPLGAGGMGEVYLARDSRLDRLVAIKIVRSHYADDPERLERFVREAKTASSLNHPNIAHIYEIGELDGLHYIVMEYVRGETLQSRIGSRGMPISDVIVLATQVADALDEAHAHGVVHRDLKPANAMITARGKVKILDFGLAKLVGGPGHTDSVLSTMPGDTMAGLVLGTLDYMSPEQVRGLPIDQRSDIFSFGVMLYEMITGRVPFASMSKTDTVYRITQVQPEALTRYNYDVTPELDRIVRKCLEKDPARRYQSVRELLVDLSSLRRETSSDSHLVAAAAPARSKRTPWIVGMAIALTAIAAGTAVWLRSRPDVIDSIAVIPDAGGSPTLLEVTDGVAASLASSLSQLANLHVAPRQRPAAAVSDTSEPRAIGSRLGVHGLLFVRVVIRGESALMYLDLVDATHGRMFWGKQYTLKLNEIELVQESISAEVAETLGLLFSAEERRAQDVFQLYQRGRYHTGRRTENDIGRAIEFFQLAIDRDRTYAKAWAGLAQAYNLLPTYSSTPPEMAFPNARAAAEQALKLDNTLAEAYTQVGQVLFRWEWDWSGAEREFGHAIKLDPAYADGHYWNGMFLTAVGRFDDALARIRTAQSLDPLSPVLRAGLGWTHFMARQYDLALTESRRAADADPTSVVPQRYLGLVYTQLGRFDEAIAAFQQAVSLSRGSTLYKAELAHTLAVAGRRTEAAQILAELRSGHPKAFVSAYSFALIAVGLGDTEGAIEQLKAAVRERASSLIWAKVDPRLDSIRADPRFVEFLTALRLQ